MDDEETILFGGPDTAVAPTPPSAAMAAVSLKSALLSSTPTEKPAESTFMSLGAPIMKKQAAPPVSPKPRIRYTRDQVMAMRKKILQTDLPPGIDPAFLKEQQDLAMGDAGFKSSPPRGQGFFGPSSYEKRQWSNSSSLEEPLSSFAGGDTRRVGSGWRSNQSTEIERPSTESGLGQRTLSWQAPYKPAGPVRSALVSNPQTPEPPSLPPPGTMMGAGRGARASFDDRGRPGDRGGRWGEGGRPGPRDGPDGGRGGRQPRGGWGPSGNPVEDAKNEKRGSVDEGPRSYVASRWEGSGKDGGDKWRKDSGAHGNSIRPSSRDWRDKTQPDERETPRQAGADKWGDGRKPAGGGAGGMSAADFEAERQRFQAEWRKGQEQAATVDDREASWLVNEASNVPAQAPAVDKLFGDALGDVPPSPEAKPLDGNASSSRFAKWFNQDAANKVNAATTPQPPPQAHQQPPQQTAPPPSLPAALLGLQGAAMPPLPKMPTSFKTLDDLEGPASGVPAPTQSASNGGNFLQMLQASATPNPSSSPAPVRNQQPKAPASPSEATWKIAAAALKPEPTPVREEPKPDAAPPPEQSSPLSSLLQGLGIPIQPGAPAPPPEVNNGPRLAADAPKTPTKGPPPGFPGGAPPTGHFPPGFPSPQPPQSMPLGGGNNNSGQPPQWPPMSHHMMPPQMHPPHPGMPGPPGAWGRPGMPPHPSMPPPHHQSMGMPPGGMHHPHGPPPPHHMMHNMPPPPGGYHPGMHSMPPPMGGMPGGPLPPGMHGGPPPGDSSLARFFGGMAGAPLGMPAMPAPPGQQKTVEELERQLQPQRQ